MTAMNDTRNEGGREYLWFAGMLIVLLAGAAMRSPQPDTASTTLETNPP
jgi:hypothetical protein